MAETVTITSQSGYDSNANPLPPGASVTLTPLAVAPGPTALALAAGGDLDDVEYTVFLELGSPVLDDDEIEVRGKSCRARVKEWISPWTGRGGIEVMCKSSTGAR